MLTSTRKTTLRSWSATKTRKNSGGFCTWSLRDSVTKTWYVFMSCEYIYIYLIYVYMYVIYTNYMCQYRCFSLDQGSVKKIRVVGKNRTNSFWSYVSLNQTQRMGTNLHDLELFLLSIQLIKTRINTLLGRVPSELWRKVSSKSIDSMLKNH